MPCVDGTELLHDDIETLRAVKAREPWCVPLDHDTITRMMRGDFYDVSRLVKLGLVSYRIEAAQLVFSLYPRGHEVLSKCDL